jgi:histidinol-phosphate aminotransferase
MAVQALGGDGARIITAHPTFEDVATYRLPLGTELIPVPLDSRFAHDLGRMREEAARSRSLSIVYVCNPNNPTGTLTDSREVQSWIQEADEDVFFIVDEAYFELVDDPTYQSCLPLTREYRNLLVVRTFSKIYGLAGMRMGYGIAHPDTVRRMTAYMAKSNANQLAVAAASASLDDWAHVQRSVDSNRAAKAVVLETLDGLGLEALPSHTNFLMHHIGVDVHGYIDRFAEAGIAVGRPFPPMLQYNRLSLGTPEEMGRWADTIRDFRRRGWI